MAASQAQAQTANSNSAMTAIVARMEAIQTSVKKALTAIYEFPATFKEKAMESSDFITERLGEYRKQMAGTSDSSNDTGMFIMDSRYNKMLNNMRKNNPDLYCLVAKIADCWATGSVLPSGYLKCANNATECPAPTKGQALVFVLNLFLIYKLDNTIKPDAQYISTLANQTTILSSDDEVQAMVNRLKA